MWQSALLSLGLAFALATAAWTDATPPIPTSASPVLSPARRDPQQVPVLLYHHLVPEAEDENGAIIPVEEFEAQMAWLKARGYTGITTAELGAWLSGRGGLPEKPVLITFDDGYRSNYEYAYPILHQYGLKAAIFMVSGYAGKKVGGLEYLGWAEMQELERAGTIEVQAHTHDGHRKIDGTAALEFWTESEIGQDLNTLQQAFDAAGLARPIALAYPFGTYDAESLRAVAGAGMQLGFTVRHGYVRKGDPPMELKRLVIFPGTSICRFGELVTGRPAGTCGNEIRPYSG